MELTKGTPALQLGVPRGAGAFLPVDKTNAKNILAGKVAVDPKLASAAHQFEASLMQELMKPLTVDPLTSGADQTGEGALTSSAEGSENALMSYGSETLARGISEHGGLGLANQILTHFAHRRPAVPGS